MKVSYAFTKHSNFYTTKHEAWLWSMHKKSCLHETSNDPTSDRLSTEKKVKSLLPSQGYMSQDKVSMNLLFSNCPEQVRK